MSPATTETGTLQTNAVAVEQGGEIRKPRVLLMGEKQSGKTSILSVIFGRMAASETLFVEPTKTTGKFPVKSFVDFELWDFGGRESVLDPAFGLWNVDEKHDTLIWVIDGQGDYFGSLHRLFDLILAVRSCYPSLPIEILLHKVDGMSDDYEMDVFEEITSRTLQELESNDLDTVFINYHRTSIYDHSISEVFSKIIRKIVPNLEIIESLLDLLCTSARIRKAFLFDTANRLYIASDCSPVNITDYELCGEHINFVHTLNEIFGSSTRIGCHETSDATIPFCTPETASMFKIDPGLALYLKEINKHLTLVCLVPDASKSKETILVNFNIEVFQESLQKVFDVSKIIH